MKRFLIAALALWLVSPLALAQTSDLPAEGIIRRIEFRGLQRISAATLRRHVTSREGETLDPARVAEDVRALERLGWFESISVEGHTLPVQLASARVIESVPVESASCALVFFLEERPFLSRVEFRGSRVLRREQIGAILAAHRISLKLAAPANRTELWRAARTLERELADLGYPQARVKVRLEPRPTLAVRAVFQIRDGPHVPVARVEFEGNAAFSDGKLRSQMKHVAPHAFLAGARDKTIYTPERLAEDLERLERFYRDRGYAEVRFQPPGAKVVEQVRRRWFPFPRREKRLAYETSIPVEEGSLYRIEAVDIEGAPPQMRAAMEPGLRELKLPTTFSETLVDCTRVRLSQVAARSLAAKDVPRPQIDVVSQFNREAGTVRVAFRVRDDEPFVVRRIEFRGHHRFSDRYCRRRVLLREGDPFDAEKLELGLAQLARSGFIRPVRADDLQVVPDLATRTVDLSIRVEEIGRQRISLVGGGGALGSTAGLAYTVFDMFGGEELITTHLEGGPGTLQLLLSIAKEGVFGTRASLGLNLFHNVVRPRLPTPSVSNRLFTSRSSGLGLVSNVPLTPRDTLGFSYEVSRSSTRFHLPQVIPGLAADLLEARSTRRAVGVAWSRESDPRVARRERLDASASLSGGWLGGDEQLLRSTVEYARLYSNPLTNGRNAWAWRSFVGGVSTYDGGSLMPHQRLFAGEQLVRGFGTGELAPYTFSTTRNADGTTTASTQTGGANLVAALNGEYRVPLESAGMSTEAVSFLDVGAGWLLPEWLGTTKEEVVWGTNGVVRSSAGIELRVDLPILHQPVRVYYAVNPLCLAGDLLLPDGTRFRPSDRRAVLGWALGPFF